MNLVLLASSIFSERAGVVAQGLHQMGHPLEAAVSVRTAKPATIARKVAELGLKECLRRALSTICTGGGRAKNATYDNGFMAELANCRGLQCLTLKGAGSKLGFPVHVVADINGPKSRRLLASYGPDFLIYTGGGLLRPALLRIPARGVLNAHSGLLPWYRGMNVAEWAVLEGKDLGVTVHFIDRGIDTGAIVTREKLELPFEVTDVKGLRDYMSAASARGMLTAVRKIVDGMCQESVQMKEAGQQYFAMHSSLVALVERRLADNA